MKGKIYPIYKTILKKDIPWKKKIKAIFAAKRIIKNREACVYVKANRLVDFCEWKSTKEGGDFWCKIYFSENIEKE